MLRTAMTKEEKNILWKDVFSLSVPSLSRWLFVQHLNVNEDSSKQGKHTQSSAPMSISSQVSRESNHDVFANYLYHYKHILSKKVEHSILFRKHTLIKQTISNKPNFISSWLGISLNNETRPVISLSNQ